MQDTLSLYLLAVLILSIYSYNLGEDLNWDQLNYHFYSGWAVHHRLRADLFSVGYQTYLNHFSYIIFYHLVRSFKPIVAATLMTSIQALNAPLIFLLARSLLQIQQRKLVWFVSALACLVGLRSPLFLSEIGGSFSDILNGIPLLAALLFAVRGLIRSRSVRSASVLIGIAGILLGALAGLKLVNLAFVIGFILAVAASWMSLRRTFILTASAALGAAVGFASTAAHLALVLWREFRNPLYPFYNNIFKSPFWPAASNQDVRWIPKSFSSGLSYPFQWLVGRSPSNEIPFQDPRFAIIVLLLVAAVIVTALKIFGEGYLDSAILGHRPDRLISAPNFRFINLFFLTSFLVWLFTFGVQRYIVPLELLTGVMILVLIDFVIPARTAKLALLITISLASMIFVKVPVWNRVPWQKEWYSVHIPPAFTAPDSLYLVFSEPAGYAFPFLPKSSRIVRVWPKVFYGDKGKLFDLTLDIVNKHKGPKYMMIAKSQFSATSMAEPLATWGLKIKGNSCTTITTRPGDLGMCSLEPFQLATTPDDIWHLGFAEPLGAAGYKYALPVNFGNAFSAELILTAGPNQATEATILSSHPGSKNFRGIFMETENTTNTYSVGVGSGTNWVPCGVFTLKPGKPSYVALEITNRRCSLYLDGSLLASSQFKTPPPDSDYPLTIGDWGAPDRPFSGAIDEVRLAHVALTPAEVYATALRLGTIH